MVVRKLKQFVLCAGLSIFCAGCTIYSIELLPPQLPITRNYQPLDLSVSLGDLVVYLGDKQITQSEDLVSRRQASFEKNVTKLQLVREVVPKGQKADVYFDLIVRGNTAASPSVGEALYKGLISVFALILPIPYPYHLGYDETIHLRANVDGNNYTLREYKLQFTLSFWGTGLLAPAFSREKLEEPLTDYIVPAIVSKVLQDYDFFKRYEQAVKSGDTELIKQVLLGDSSVKLADLSKKKAPPSTSMAAKPPVPQTLKMRTSEVDTVPRGLAQLNKHAYAIVVGIEQYQQALPKADFAVHDAEVMGQYLTKSLGYAEENVVVLLNERATKTGIEKYIEAWLADRVENGDSVFVYFSGHGAPNSKTGRAYLVPYDGDPAFVDKTGYPLDRLYSSLAELPAKEVVVMLDSCFSGAGGRSVIAEGMRPMMLSVENPVLAKGKVVVLAASTGGQVSSTYKQQSHGLLTYYFLKGLQGEADQNRDDRIELGELFAYLKPQVERTARRDYHNEQTPQLLGSPDVLSRGVVLMRTDAQSQ